MLSGDADTRVAHNEFDRMLPSADDELDRAGGRRVPQRVGEQITEYLLCAVPIGSRKVTLIDRLSDASCTKGKDWDYTRDAIWVSNGCRAVFEIK